MGRGGVVILAAAGHSTGVVVGCGRIITTTTNDPANQPAPTNDPTPTGDPGSGYLLSVTNAADGSPIVARLDLETAAVSKVADLPSNYEVAGEGPSAVVDVSRHVIYVMTWTQAPNSSRIATVDYTTGMVVADVPVSGDVAALSLNQQTGALLTSMNLDPTGATFSTVEIDPANGSVTTVATWPTPAISGGGGVFDGHSKFYETVPSLDAFSSPSTLRVSDLASGSVESTQLTADNVESLGYDGNLGRVIGASIHSSGANAVDGVSIVAIDPSNGAVETKANFPNLTHAFMTATATDAATHRYFFIAGDGQWEGGSAWMSGNDLYTFDVSTSTLLAKPSISWGQALNSLQIVPD